jgi:hypothetical protein
MKVSATVEDKKTIGKGQVYLYLITYDVYRLTVSFEVISYDGITKKS